jgi:hypothetical protein
MIYEYGETEYEGKEAAFSRSIRREKTLSNDFYNYPGTSVLLGVFSCLKRFRQLKAPFLMNRFDIREQDELTKIERGISQAKISYLQANPIKDVLDLKYF